MVNSGSAAFDGRITFAPSLGFGGSRGARYIQSAFIGPQSSRWVQFEVFIGSDMEEFTLSWGAGPKDRETFDRQIQTGPPACVWLVDANDPLARPGAFKAFPDQLFPTTVAATDGLDSVILDYTPRWEPARREAFLDWVKRGGTLHLVHGANGELPVFTDTLAVLNGEAETTRVGAGQVVRHRVPRADLRPTTLATRGFPPREIVSVRSVATNNIEQVFFQRLSSLTRPKVSWWLLNSLTILYIVLIGPVAWRFARRMDYRWTIAGFLATVGLFGFAFSVVGRRGYGESQTVHSISVARSLGGGRWDVTQWLSAFATSSGQYVLSHRAPVNLYATSTSDDADRGMVENGKDGKFYADIPLYSSRTFTHRGVMPGDDLGFTVEEWKASPFDLEKLRLKPGPGFPRDAFGVFALFGKSLYTLEFRNGAWTLTNNQGISEALGSQRLQQITYSGVFERDERPPWERLKEVLPLVQARALEVGDIAPQFSQRPMAANQVRIIVAAPAPPSFHMTGEGFAHENGLVLYVEDVFKP
jgi:hypothetical protein